MKNNHWICIIIGCVIPLLLIFLLGPYLGMRGGSSLFLFVILMFAFHLFMPHGGHGHDGRTHSTHEQNKRQNSKETPLAKPRDDSERHLNH